MTNIAFQGEYTIKHVRNGVLIGTYTLPNGVTYQGFDRMFDLWFHSNTNTPVEMGVIDGNLFGGLSPFDTAASHPGWNAYAGLVLQTVNFTVANNKAISTSTSVRLDIPSNGFVKGIYLQTNDGLYLWSTAIYTGGLLTTKSLIVNAGDTLYVNYNVSGTATINNTNVKNDGITRALDLWFNGQTNTPVVMGLIDKTGFTGILATDTVASHPGWFVFNSVEGGPLQPLVLTAGGSPSTGSIQTDVSAIVGTRFNITADGEIDGYFVQTDDDSFLWSTFQKRLLVKTGQSFFISYTDTGVPLT